MLEQDCRELATTGRAERSIPEKAEALQALGIKRKGWKATRTGQAICGAGEGDRDAWHRSAGAAQGKFRKYGAAAGADQTAGAHTGRRAGQSAGADPQPGGAGRPSEALRFDRAAETWAAVSLSLLLFVIAGLIFFAPHYIWAGLAVILMLFVTRSRSCAGLRADGGRITLILAMLASVILVIHFWKWIILVRCW